MFSEMKGKINIMSYILGTKKIKSTIISNFPWFECTGLLSEFPAPPIREARTGKWTSELWHYIQTPTKEFQFTDEKNESSEAWNDLIMVSKLLSDPQREGTWLSKFSGNSWM